MEVKTDRYSLYQGDCLDIMDELIEQNIKVDMILTDIPYGTTQCKWDSVIPFEPMWERVKTLNHEASWDIETSDDIEKYLSGLRTQLLKQLEEARDYDEKISHLALARIDIDLDDGVKVNYEKVQTAQDGKKLEVLVPIK